MTLEEEYKLIRYAKRTKKGKAKVIANYSNLVAKIAGKYKFKKNVYNVEFDDLYEEGIIGLLYAIKLFKFDRGVRFITYAHRAITTHICRAIENAHLIKIPPDTLKNTNKWDNIKMSLSHQLGRQPSDEEIGDAFNITKTRLKTIESGLKTRFEASNINFDYHFYSEGDFNNNDEEISRLKTVMNNLPEFEKQVLFMRVYDNLTYRQVGSKLGVCYETVRNVVKKIYKQIREEMREE